MKCKRKIMVGIAFVAVALCILFQLNTSGRKKSELIVEEVDLKNNCIYSLILAVQSCPIVFRQLTAFLPCSFPVHLSTFGKAGGFPRCFAG